MNTRRFLGEFETSGEMHVSDPCYDGLDDFLFTATVEVKPGKWLAWIEVSDENEWGHRVSHLYASHISRPVSVYDPWGEAIHDNIGVDSGQAGFFDLAHYRRDEDAAGYPWPTGPNSKWLRDIAERDPWYAMCCCQTVSHIRPAGVVPGGCVSSSGFGDGAYLLFAQQDEAGVTDALLLEFISPDESEDDDGWEPDEDDCNGDLHEAVTGIHKYA
jgi:hypothetical protein